MANENTSKRREVKLKKDLLSKKTSQYNYISAERLIIKSKSPLKNQLTEDVTVMPSETSGVDKQFGGTGRCCMIYPSWKKHPLAASFFLVASGIFFRIFSTWS